MQRRPNYGAGVKVRSKLPSPPGRDDLREMVLANISCVEEEGARHIKRVNKSREIEKEFREKKLQLALMSNKEARRMVGDNRCITRPILLALIMIAIYIGVPVTVYSIVYSRTRSNLDVSWNAGKYVSYARRFTEEYVEVFHSVILMANLNEYAIHPAKLR